MEAPTAQLSGTPNTYTRISKVFRNVDTSYSVILIGIINEQDIYTRQLARRKKANLSLFTYQTLILKRIIQYDHDFFTHLRAIDLIYCDPSCCPPNSPRVVTILKLLPTGPITLYRNKQLLANQPLLALIRKSVQKSIQQPTQLSYERKEDPLPIKN